MTVPESLLLTLMLLGAVPLATLVGASAMVPPDGRRPGWRQWRRIRCEHCQQVPGHWAEWLPLVPSLVPRCRCTECAERPSLARGLAEAAVLCAGPLCLWRFGATPLAVAWLVFHALLLTCALVEWRTRQLPILPALAGTIGGLAIAALQWPDVTALRDSGIGAVAGFSLLWLAGLAQARWRAAAMGQGCLPEAVLFAMVGAWFGWRALPAAMLGSFILLALTQLSTAARRGRSLPYRRVPCWSPALAASVVFYEVLNHVA